MAFVLRLLCVIASMCLVLAKDAIVVFVVDPDWDCVNSYVAHVPLLQQYKIVKIFIRPGPANTCKDRPDVDIYQTMVYNSTSHNDTLAAEEFCPLLQNMSFPVAAVIPTFDPPTYLANRLAACVGARGNPYKGPLAHARFDKLAMSEAVRNAGLRAVKERVVTSWAEAKPYLDSLNPPLSDTHPVIFKVVQGSDSQGVMKVSSLKQAEEYFANEVGSTTTWGDKVEKVLVQEFFKGREYVVDSVSRDGVHKTVAVFYEDLRPGNGFFDLYYGFIMMDPRDPKTMAIIDYANKVLNATGVQNGASDMELFWIDEENAPCVTDLNARWTALMWDDGLFLEEAVTGHNQITAAVDALLDADGFNKMPPVFSLSKQAALLFVKPHHVGTIEGIPGVAFAERLPSYFRSINEGLPIGTKVEQLVNTGPSVYVLLAHNNGSVLIEDYDRLINLQLSDGFFDIVPTSAHASPTVPEPTEPSPTVPSPTVLRPRSNGMLEKKVRVIAATVTMVAVAVLFVFLTTRRQKLRDDTAYLIIE